MILEIFKNYLPTKPKCLELFARNLLSNFTSIGFEVIKLQNKKLFNEIIIEEEKNLIAI